jgi:putative ABC transport system permease protein
VSFARLALADLFRNPLRLALTVLATGVGVVAFLFLQTVIHLWYAGVAAAQPDRLIVFNKAFLTQPLPLSYLQRLRGVPGVSAATYAGWFGGRISERASDFFASFFVDQATYLGVFSDLVLPPEQLAAWKADPCGAIVGKALADRFRWKVGDRISMKGDLSPGDWVFTVRGVFAGKTPEVDTAVLAFGHRCLNERAPEDLKDRVGFFALRIDDPARSAEVAAAIDGMFANSPAPTKTESERSFQLGFVAMSGAILEALRIVSFVILAIMLLVVSNTMAMGVRERTSEIATLRALGFRRPFLVGLMVSESTAIALASAALGSAAATPLVRAFRALASKGFGPLPPVSVAPATLALGAAATLAVGLAAVLAPAIHAARLPIAEGLRRVA